MNMQASEKEGWRQQLLDGITAIPQDGVPGTIVVYGENAEPILTTRKESNILVAAAELGKGRVIVFAHDGYIMKFLKQNFDENDLDLAAFWQNIKRWVSKGHFDGQHDLQLIDEQEDASDFTDTHKLLLWQGHSHKSDEFIEDVISFVEEGGGIICGMCPWGYLQIHGGKLEDMPYYDLLSAIGVYFTKNYLDGAKDGKIEVSTNLAESSHMMTIMSKNALTQKESDLVSQHRSHISQQKDSAKKRFSAPKHLHVVPEREGWRKELLEGVHVIPQIGIPGTIVVYGENAEPVLTTNLMNNVLIAAAELGEGRVVVIPHNGYIKKFSEENFTNDHDLPVLWENIKQWVSKGKYSCDSDIEILDSVKDVDELTENSVWLWDGAKESQEMAQAAVEFVRNGGGLVCGMCPWGYLQIHGGSLEDMACYTLFREIGVCYTTGYLEGVTGGEIKIAKNKARDAHLRRAADECCGNSNLLKSVGMTLGGLRHIPVHLQEGFLESVEEILEHSRGVFNCVPSQKQPLQQPAELCVASLCDTMMSTGRMKKAPGVEHFPGEFSDTPAVVSAPVSLLFKSVREEVFPTGYYLPAGEVLYLKVESKDVGLWVVHIGAQSDELANKSKLHRWPKVCIKRELSQDELSVASPFGGLVYFKSPNRTSSLTVNMANVVQAPYVDVYDSDSLAAWNERSKAQGLWGDLIGRYVMMTLPRSAIQHISDPSRFIQFWDSVVETHHALRGTDPGQHRRQWIVPDVQPCAGYMHAGYPIVTHMDIADPKADVCVWNTDILATDKNHNWGLFHEIGHNMQRTQWTFEGTGEVTVNIFTLHAMEKLCGMKPWSHPWLKNQYPGMKNYLTNGANFEQWKADPGVALGIYAQLARDFGWEVYKQVFRTYEDDMTNKSPQPSNNQEKIDWWMTRFSHAVGMNLSPMFEFWGIPLSDNAMVSVADLPPYLCQDETNEWAPDRVSWVRQKYPAL